MAVIQVWLSEVHQWIVPNSCTEVSVAEAGLCPTEEKHTSLCRAQSSWTNVFNKAAVVSQVAVQTTPGG